MGSQSTIERDRNLPVAPPRRGRRTLTVGLLIAGLAVLAFVLWEFIRPEPAPARLDAAPPAATPVGYRVVAAPNYRFAVPDGWTIETLDPKDFGTQIARPGTPVPGSDASVLNVSDVLDGAPTLATDPVTHDNVEAIRVDADVVGNPKDPAVRADLKETLQSLGRATGPVRAVAADVHGFPAVRLQMETVVQNTPLTMISTIIQTGDHAFQLVVTSPSGARAADLSNHIVPTFAPR